ncbi:MAG: peptide deformylase [Candidatus Neomarinimicrobiota bacterium]|nr:peptide deformylase [Candidatus Neomarinimicrobiota bacterium]RKY47658.1 MAG: peptide deformylase [Candidatus Neomarinimicrobiota bacterium]HDN59661.1 peptide deformylase [Candidatus Neomarinimicrobiota bacterium]
MKIYLYGSPILEKKVARVENLPEDFEKIIREMFNTMYDNSGIGLSANQVGLDMSFFITDISVHDPHFSRRVFINPEIVAAEGESEMEEGCLSIPGIRSTVIRPEKIVLRYMTPEGDLKEERFTDLMARVIQHETDHLNGIYFIDRISPLKRSFLSPKLKKLKEQALKEI